MALFAHPEILEEIRKGVKLRSASTIDKSRPKIQADGEDIPKLVVRQYDETFSGPNGYSPPISTSASADNYCESPNGATPRAAPPPPRVSSGGAPKKPAAAFRLGGGGKDVPVDREKLLHSIKCGIRLRPTATNDRSGLILDEDQKTHILHGGGSRTATPNSLSSLDSQGMSSAQTPSPSCSSEPSHLSSSTNGYSPQSSCCNNNNNENHPSPLPINSSSPHSMPTAQQQMPSPSRMGSLWIRCDSDAVASQSNSNSPVSTGRLLIPVTPSATPLLPPSMPPSQANSPSINGGGNINGESDACQTEKKKSDFCFDEEAQVKQRQSEVAQLAGKGSAKGALAIFQQLQKSASSSSNNNFVDRQPSFRQGVKSTNKFCTLPRKCQTNAVNSPDNSHHNSLQRLVDVKPLKQKVEPQPSNSSRSHHHPLPISTALPSNNGKPFVDNGKPADNADNNENQQQKESPPSEPVYASPPVKDVIRRMNISTERQPVLPAVAVSSKMVISPAESDYHHQQQQQQANRPAGPRQQPATTLKITPMAKWWNEHVTPPASPSFHHKQQQKASCMFPPASPSASPAPSSASSTGVVNAVKGQTVILHKVQSADGWQRNAISASPSPLMFLHHYQHRPPSVQPYDTNPPLPSAGSSSSSQSLNGSQTIFARAFPARVATRNNPHFDKIRQSFNKHQNVAVVTGSSRSSSRSRDQQSPCPSSFEQPISTHKAAAAAVDEPSAIWKQNVVNKWAKVPQDSEDDFDAPPTPLQQKGQQQQHQHKGWRIPPVASATAATASEERKLSLEIPASSASRRSPHSPTGDLMATSMMRGRQYKFSINSKGAGGGDGSSIDSSDEVVRVIRC